MHTAIKAGLAPASAPDQQAPFAFTIAYIGIGANLGDARGNVQDALARLQRQPGCTLMAASGLYRTAPIDSSGDDYINAVARIATTLDAETLLQTLHAIEQAHGRERPYRNAPRTLDLDLLLYGDAVIHSATLTVPHPRMTERAFVLVPLLEIAPAIHIPGLGPAAQYAAGVADQGIAPLS
ncbi:2-amino-4-hydroxy-6-hydroxymethyldihydropteridine diphosphokinase [Duganella sp. FT80W]|uniref:2-amino-4-hydroxy-6-hydroxymethyldihydropteridine pyrophosphokinase n=1 Tax=Duganella guangzhouensis TaxID=2666084 RepID=A0A6I2L683_9BURK|nr:2-amino-4-hydroxy-6-hydroxymethyldihydropteridine diphosphokinase [Duganella guangzhouensis]MRW92394.1 2-amino-4-hydroxy-6-hydroxymethyldihydropteridine diphosphokinase [Duganella guangzhouensis]